MAAKIYFLYMSALFVQINAEFTAFNRPIPFVDKNTCIQTGTTAQFYDSTKLECRSCSQNKTAQSVSADGKSKHVLQSRGSSSVF